MTLRINNRDARRLWLAANGLYGSPTGPLDVMAIIHDLGFVQLDTIRNVTRAQNHIIWSRNQNFREGKLWPLLKSRELFEHFTHDASLIPMEFLPMWQRQFQQLGEQVARSKWCDTALSASIIADIKTRISSEGPLSTHAFDTKVEGKREMWTRPPHKKALDQMWYAGVLATSHREKFVKFYDLAGRVFGEGSKNVGPTDDEQIDWLCNSALDRLWLANPGEVQRFWGALSAVETKQWTRQQELMEVEVEGADGSTTTAFALPNILEKLGTLGKPSPRIRILNPFDPAIRDRARLERLFGFTYRNEMFVPKKDRKWGYYVYPLLEGDRLIGRLELKADRKLDRMDVSGFWEEPGVKWGEVRQKRLDMELDRFARFVGITNVNWKVAR